MELHKSFSKEKYKEKPERKEQKPLDISKVLEVKEVICKTVPEKSSENFHIDESLDEAKRMKQIITQMNQSSVVIPKVSQLNK